MRELVLKEAFESACRQQADVINEHFVVATKIYIDLKCGEPDPTKKDEREVAASMLGHLFALQKINKELPFLFDNKNSKKLSQQFNRAFKMLLNDCTPEKIDEFIDGIEIVLFNLKRYNKDRLSSLIPKNEGFEYIDGLLSTAEEYDNILIKINSRLGDLAKTEFGKEWKEYLKEFNMHMPILKDNIEKLKINKELGNANPEKNAGNIYRFHNSGKIKKLGLNGPQSLMERFNRSMSTLT